MVSKVIRIFNIIFILVGFMRISRISILFVVGILLFVMVKKCQQYLFSIKIYILKLQRATVPIFFCMVVTAFILLNGFQSLTTVSDHLVIKLIKK